MTPFDLYVGVDWSGARGPGLRVAVCPPGSWAPRFLANPDGGAWARSAFATWLAKLTRARRVLCGLDFAFSLPFADEGAYLPGLEPAPRGMARLWRLVDRVCAADHDFYAGRFVVDPPYGNYFRGPGRRRDACYDRWPGRLRLIDRVCGDSRRYGRPESVFKAVGAKQVALGSLAGMRVLHWLRGAAPRVGIWPRQSPRAARSHVIEIYPAAFLGQVGYRARKFRDLATLNDVIAAFQSRPVRDDSLDGLARDVDDKTDALVAAAAIRALAGERDCWRPLGWMMAARRREGWIFGVSEGTRAR